MVPFEKPCFILQRLTCRCVRMYTTEGVLAKSYHTSQFSYGDTKLWFCDVLDVSLLTNICSPFFLLLINKYYVNHKENHCGQLCRNLSCQYHPLNKKGIMPVVSFHTVRGPQLTHCLHIFQIVSLEVC